MSIDEQELVRYTKDGAFEFYVDGAFYYDLTVRDAMDCLHWIICLGDKTWVTKEHLEQFANLAFQSFGGQH